MGRPYQKEIAELPLVHDNVNSLNIDALCAWIIAAARGPLIAIGSGGSFTAAQMMVALHQKYSGQLAKAMTPLEVADSIDVISGCNVVLFSSSGRNEDVLSIAELVTMREPLHLLAVCARLDSPLEQLLKIDETAIQFTFDLQEYKDGFLATNSLYAFCLLLGRAYTRIQSNDSAEANPKCVLPLSWGDIEKGIPDIESLSLTLGAGKRDTLIVLYSPSLKTGAVDIESRFTEAALGHAQIADLRNFAHGRHHWIAKRGDTSSVLCLTDTASKAVSEKTISLLPLTVPSAVVEFEDSIAGLLQSVVFSIRLALPFGKALKLDPGRPTVPTFGRRIYHLKGAYKGKKVELSQPGYLPVRRKLKGRTLTAANLGTAYEAHAAFVKRLTGAKFRGVILDYDGTLCRASERYTTVSDDVGQVLVRLLEAGMLIGIATGRGDSVREALRQVVPELLQSQVIIGYYNCTQIGVLNDDARPAKGHMDGQLATIAAFLQSQEQVSDAVDIGLSPGQITLRAKHPAGVTILDMLIEKLRIHFPSMNLVRSTHSVDILREEGSKNALFNEFSARGYAADEFLVLGDQGLWPGNDHALLSSPHSLSVDQVSLSLDSCWNLARPGKRGVSAALNYLRALQPDAATSASIPEEDLI